MEICQDLQKNPWLSAFQKGFCTFVEMFFDLLPIFHVKLELFVTKNVRSGSGSAWIRIGLASWIVDTYPH
jgi:hypothetical protein